MVGPVYVVAMARHTCKVNIFLHNINYMQNKNILNVLWIEINDMAVFEVEWNMMCMKSKTNYQ